MARADLADRPGGVAMSKAARPKSVAQVSLACFHPPAASSVTGHGCEKPKPVSIIMTIERPMFPPRAEVIDFPRPSPKRKWTRRTPRDGEDPIFAAIENHRTANAAKVEYYAEADRLLKKHGKSFDFDTYTDDAYNQAWDTLDDFAETVPTMAAGVMVMLIYTSEVAADYPLSIFETLATAAKALTGGQS
jgi:hypothetical protein